ncbi:MAG: AmmeMemoRadiSam system protein B [Bdellovibrionales bacterium]|nr:AmmeMemoRadiSam system protein B [Bdellovibrionales bacterium]
MDIRVRPTFVAGSFYPARTDQLSQLIQSFIHSVPNFHYNVKALIVPHAGYKYSGPIAASAYKLLGSQAHEIKRIVLLGPAHRVAFSGLALPEANFFDCPLGQLKVDDKLKNSIASVEGVIVSDLVHAHEHSLEVQLPFIKTVVPNATILPILVGMASPRQIQRVLESLQLDKDTLLIVSSDLSHYHSHQVAQKLDSETAAEIEHLNSNLLSGERACGYIAIQGLINYAKQKQWKCQLLDLRDSSDTAGEPDSVVGYGAFAFYE